ncbi:BTAD domain-containing putative transcriptional regulator [Plantactinospora siamensis]|uniref:BTAD domain-containing putative transcriptional regulator n=1 Tax=Plantactinospora siamensis TaxID=555372 RepID=A0ABV6P4S0_9ACTN
MNIEFRLLGELEARAADRRPVHLGHHRQRCVLAILLVEANRTVGADQLAARVWGDDPPPGARGTLRSYLSRLRQALSPAGCLVERRWTGYAVAVDEESVDLHRFRRLVAQARRVGPGEPAMELLDEALRLWRGDAFATLDAPWLNSLRETVARERLLTQLDRAELGLRRGRHAELLPELSALRAAHPLDERLVGQLMLALYRCGHQAEALIEYDRLRRSLAEEFGVDPVPDAQALHHAILRADPELTAGAADRTAGSRPFEFGRH